MVDNNSRSRLFWLQLKLLAQLNADARRIEQREKLLLIFESRTRRITEAETRALIFLLEQSRQLRRILSCDTELFTLLDPSRIGVELSEEFQLEPEQSTSAIIVHHPEAKYFSIE